ncbi:mRNA decay activator protein ZFP36L2-A [Larimichthys crocea]|uniref:mRNA decay activator protein ZFP36 n=2 Tax=Larimichthys crocea TaxID=215358 RepID=A0A6G0HHW4_LARCR|nr:mRNA decay activator protein ZFP36L2 [Larimichthys crocea]KAE8278829.1 mRNA decay activator protein ZFP36L2-A [Larimichthys crocea]TMS02491.1 mRNA decay activator protein ZFP36L2-A [Larimichthys crocea]
MFETSRDDLFLPSYQDEEMVDNLLSSEESDGDSGGVSLAKALLPLVESSSPPLIPWVCSTRYKTELCTSYSASGLCKYAERCQFAHGLHELHVPFRHPKYKTELCRSYHTTGYCYYGSRCLFVHNPTEQRPTQRRRRTVACRTFRSFGVCPFGTRCNFLHVESGDVGSGPESPGVSEEKTSPVPSPQLQPQTKEWKPRGALCRIFSSFGFCLYGTRCLFQHGLPSKIKPSEQTHGGSLYPPLTPGSSGLPSPASLFTSTSPMSSTSSSPLSASPLATPTAEATAHNAFTFSSQHLSDLLLPLALHLQQLESSKAQEIWDNRAL